MTKQNLLVLFSLLTLSASAESWGAKPIARPNGVPAPTTEAPKASVASAAKGDTAPGARFQNLDRMIEELNLRPYFQEGVRARKRLKVAVFDNGFRGAAGEIGRSLPRSTKIHRGPVPIQGEEEVHGFYMARIFWSLLSLDGEDNRYAPVELHLYNTFGYSNLKAAVDDAIRNRVDLVLYSQTWEYGGNFDGRGFINTQISRAVDAGILWINNSGNVGNTTFNAGIETGEDDWVQLPGRNSSVEVRCLPNPTNECQVRAVLSWNDFSDDVEQGSDKDLDFVITDDTLNVIQGSSLTQSKEAGDRPGSSKYPREIVMAKLKPGLYFFRVKNRSKNFDRKDRLRLVVDGEFLQMDRHDREESLLPPADNAGVITVGALDSERSSLSQRHHKPELWTNSLVSLSQKENFKGTSNSAAMVAAGATILLSIDPNLSRDDIIRQTGNWQPPAPVTGQGLPLPMLGFMPTSREGCFSPVNPEELDLPANITYALNFEGTLVQTTAGLKIFYNYDPIRLAPRVMRRAPNDILVITAQGPALFPRGTMLPQNFVELVQTPMGQKVCGTTAPISLPAWSKLFRLPGIR